MILLLYVRLDLAIMERFYFLIVPICCFASGEEGLDVIMHWGSRSELKCGYVSCLYKTTCKRWKTKRMKSVECVCAIYYLNGRSGTHWINYMSYFISILVEH